MQKKNDSLYCVLQPVLVARQLVSNFLFTVDKSLRYEYRCDLRLRSVQIYMALLFLPTPLAFFALEGGGHLLWHEIFFRRR